MSAADTASIAAAPIASDLFAAPVAVRVAPIDATLADLLPEERVAVERAVAKRQREFATGRRIARELLAELGFARCALPRNADRTPGWPPGVVGSISHCDHLCAVALAPTGAIAALAAAIPPGAIAALAAAIPPGGIAALGIDVEPDQPLDAALWSRIATQGEIERVVASRPTGAEQGRAARLLFCAKEAFYKSVHARVGRVLGFHEVEIQVDWQSGRFLAWLEGTPTGAPDGTRFEGRFARREGFVLAGATLRIAETEGTQR